MPPLHVPAFCSLASCFAEATRWFEAGERTFYLCEEHAEAVSPGDDLVSWPDPESGRICRRARRLRVLGRECNS